MSAEPSADTTAPRPPPEEQLARRMRRPASVEVSLPVTQLTMPGNVATPSLADCAPYLRGKVVGKEVFKHLARLIQLRAGAPFPMANVIDVCIGKVIQNMAVYVMLWHPACVPTGAHYDNDELAVYANCPDGPYVYVWQTWYAEAGVSEAQAVGYSVMAPKAVMPLPMYQWYQEQLKKTLEQQAKAERGDHGESGESG